MNVQLARKYIADGMTYADVAAKFNVSRQCVHQTVQAYEKFKVKESACIYDGLRQWMNKNHIRVAGFCKVCSACTDISESRIRGYLRGTHDMTKSAIDVVLWATGLTYEQAFGSKAREKF